MVNKKNWLGMLVMVLVFGMTVVGCGEKEEEKGNGNIPGGGKFTITGIPSTYNGMYAYFASWGDGDKGFLYGFQSVSATNTTPAKISGGSVTLTMWKSQKVNDISGYTGNDTVSGNIGICERIDGWTSPH